MKTRSTIPANVQTALLDSQLELDIQNGRSARGTSVRSTRNRAGRASWWFARMRQVVDSARGWHPTLTPRPEQIWFPDAQRQIVLSDERQVCE
jgi:hypothetical protein